MTPVSTAPLPLTFGRGDSVGGGSGFEGVTVGGQSLYNIFLKEEWIKNTA